MYRPNTASRNKRALNPDEKFHGLRGYISKKKQSISGSSSIEKPHRPRRNVLAEECNYELLPPLRNASDCVRNTTDKQNFRDRRRTRQTKSKRCLAAHQVIISSSPYPVPSPYHITSFSKNGERPRSSHPTLLLSPRTASTPSPKLSCPVIARVSLLRPRIREVSKTSAPLPYVPLTLHRPPTAI